MTPLDVHCSSPVPSLAHSFSCAFARIAELVRIGSDVKRPRVDHRRSVDVAIARFVVV